MKFQKKKIDVKIKSFDVILIFSSLQRNCFYSSITKHLSRKYKIGIFLLDSIKKSPKRIEKSNKKFLKHCKNLGADIINNQNVISKIEIITQANFTKEDINFINSRITAHKTFFHIGVAMGNAYFENLYGKKVHRILVPDLAFYKYRLSIYGNDGVDFPFDKIEEVGIPYKMYPFFEKKLDIDYIIATPTPFSFKYLKDRFDYLENVLMLLTQITDKSKIYYKPHNADERVDYIVNKKFLFFVKLLIPKNFNKLFLKIFKLVLKKTNFDSVKAFFLELCIAVLYNRILNNVRKLSEITEFHYLNLEIFLPSVRKGLITGRSNSIWYGLYSRLPVYNCVDEKKEYFSETKMHKYSMQYLNIHENYKTLKFQKNNFDLIDNTTRNADIISFLIRELKEVR